MIIPITADTERQKISLKSSFFSINVIDSSYETYLFRIEWKFDKGVFWSIDQEAYTIDRQISKNLSKEIWR